MFTSIKNRIKKISGLVTALLIAAHGLQAQPVHLQPEMDINSGLPTNSIRVIKQDDKHRIWLGTDQGLVILNDKDSSFKNITNKIGNQQVWALAFYKNHTLIGTRFSGLFIYDLSNNQLVKYYDSSDIGLCRRFKVINDTVFIATNGSALYLVKANKNWDLTKIKSTIPDGFFTDFALWNNQVFASPYSYGNQHLYQFNNDSLVPSSLIKPFEFSTNMIPSLVLTSNDSLLVMGGDGFNIRINKNQEKIFDRQITKSPYKRYPTWDAEIADSRVYLSLGNSDNNQQGMIYEPDKTTLNEVKDSYFGQSLYFDKKKKGMWAGTFNKGLFYWPWINESYPVWNKTTNEYTFKPINYKYGLLFNGEKVYKTNLANNEFVEIFDGLKQKNPRQILDAIRWDDTTAILQEKDLFLVDGKGNITSFIATQGNYIHKKGSFLYIFSLYYDFVIVINLKNNSSTKLSCTSNQISATPYNGNLFYSSANTGFHYFDTTLHNFNIPFATVESYTIQSDTLWVLNAEIIKGFRIDLKDYKLIPLLENNIKNQVVGFSPNWVLQNNGKVYCGDNKGFFLIDTKTGKPYSYTYIGNYSKGKPPVSDGVFMYFNQKNYITKLDPESFKTNITDSLVTISIFPEKIIYQHTPFTIYFNSEDYLIQKHSLKEIEIFKSNKLIRTLFTIDDHYEFPSGMERGDYVIRFKVNGVHIEERKVSISIPLTSNPLFYVCITIFIYAFFRVLFKSVLNKRSFNKRILENRLQLLKQNLNSHFIFNSLNLIYSLVLQRKNKAAIKTINNFSDLYRYYLNNINKPKISIEEELKFVESYLNLEAERVGVDTPFIYQLPKNLDGHIKSVLLPPMILQPLVENAVKYCGADISASSDSCIWIDIKKSGNKLIIGVENTIETEDTKIHGSGNGLRLVNERIEIFNKTLKESISLRVADSLLHCKSGYRCELVV